MYGEGKIIMPNSLDILDMLAKIDNLNHRANIAFRNNQVLRSEAVKDMEVYLKAIEMKIHLYFTFQ